MNPIFRYTTLIITPILVSIHVLILPARAMEGPNIIPRVPVNPVVELAQKDAKQDTGHDADLRWFAYGGGCWMFAVAYANLSNPTVPSHRLLGKSPEYVDTYSDAYKRAIKNRRMKMAGIGWSISLVATLWLWSIFMD
ncbi:hypothetical protein C6503_00275 [Candidatus Poribacteria bacterium]|nr:MAG: hypothetical protein C6503_00275 [Candidatus Poribacteria bacterium]